MSVIIITTLCSLSVPNSYTAPHYFNRALLKVISFSLLTTEFLQRLLRVRLPVAALPDVIGLQLYHRLHSRQGTPTCFQVHLGKQLPASSPWLIVHPLVPTFRGKKKRCLVVHIDVSVVSYIAITDNLVSHSKQLLIFFSSSYLNEIIYTLWHCHYMWNDTWWVVHISLTTQKLDSWFEISYSC